MADNLYEDENVLRYDSYAYKQKYGDKWKKLASCVRDVPQPDGSIIREYVIDDPSLLDQLSEESDAYEEVNENVQNFEVNKTNSNRNLKFSSNNNNNNTTAAASSLSSSSNSQNIKTYSPLISDNKQFNYSKAQDNISITSNNRKNSLNNNSNATIDSRNIAEKKDNPNQIRRLSANEGLRHSPITNSNISGKADLQNINQKQNTFDDDLDKEIETIHEEGKKFLPSQTHKINSSNEINNPIYEYEIVDENGNLMKLDNAEQLKQLAASVKCVKQADGSIVKEYLLSDPGVIEQIRNQLQQSKSKQNDTPSIQQDTHSKIPSNQTPNRHQNSSNPHFQTPLLNQQQQQRVPSSTSGMHTPQQTTHKQNLYYLDPSIAHATPINHQINSIKHDEKMTQVSPYMNQTFLNDIDLKLIDKNTYELTTKTGRTIQFQILSKNATTDDVKNVQYAIENHMLNRSNSFIKSINNRNNENIERNYISEPYYEKQSSASKLRDGNSYTNLAKSKLNKSTENLFATEYDKDQQSSAFLNYKQLKQPTITKIIHDEENKINESQNFKRSQSLGYVYDDYENQRKNTVKNNQNNDDNQNEVTPEMTEQLILRLLLQQLLLQQKNSTLNNTVELRSTNNSNRLESNFTKHERKGDKIISNIPVQTTPNLENYSTKPTLKRSTAFTNNGYGNFGFRR